jgi:hypothetical protein
MNYKTSLVSILAVVVQLDPVCSLAASYHSGSNPIGEKAYAAHSLTLLLPVGIIVGGFLLAWLLTRIRDKASKPAADDPKSHHC